MGFGLIFRLESVREGGVLRGLGLVCWGLTQGLWGFFGIVAKNSRKGEKVVDSLEGRRLYTPHQRGRRAAGDEEVRF